MTTKLNLNLRRIAVRRSSKCTGEVVAVYRDFDVGDQVQFGEYGGSTTVIDGEELLILNEAEIFGKLEETDK